MYMYMYLCILVYIIYSSVFHIHAEKELTENGNFRLFAANGRETRKFVFLGQQMN